MTDKTLDELSRLFKADEGPRFGDVIDAGNAAPSTEITSSKLNRDHQVALDITVPDTLRCLAGHFPDQPVLPGVMQVDWAGHIAQYWFPELGEFTRLNNVKFIAMILPNTHLRLTLNYFAEKNQVGFHYADQNTLFSSGTLVFSAL